MPHKKRLPPGTAPEGSALDSGPDRSFRKNAAAAATHWALQFPDGVHNRKQRRALSRAISKQATKAILDEALSVARNTGIIPPVKEPA